MPHAPVAQWIERQPPELKVARSTRAGRTIPSRIIFTKPIICPDEGDRNANLCGRIFISILYTNEEKTMLSSMESVVRRIGRIKHVEHIENKIILQGVEEGVENVDDGLVWSMAISKKTGKVVLSASGDGVAYVVFGTCTVVY